MLRVMEKRIKITEEEKLMKANEQIKELGLDDFYIVKENDCYVLYQYPCVEAARSQKLEWCVGMAQLFVQYCNLRCCFIFLSFKNVAMK